MFSTLAYSVAGGMLITVATARTGDLAWRFLRLVGVIVLALCALPAAWALDQTGAAAGWPWIAAAVAGVAAIVVIFSAPAGTVSRSRTVALIGAAGAVVASIGGTFTLVRAESSPAGVWLAAAVNQALAALFLGSITASWLLGHAYLTATKMTIAPLRRFTNLLTWSVAARAAFVGTSISAAWLLGAVPGSASGSVGEAGAPVAAMSLGFVGFLGRWWLFLVLRIGVGLIAVGVFAWMVRDCVRLRSTQSATGILYFGSIFAYVGEMAAYQLSLEWHWPV